jgi:DNA polymerase I-like protein with 3'-5' exonuclease and polymerase domains
MARYAFDIETDGLLDQLTTIHSLVIQDVDTGEMISASSENLDIKDTLSTLMKADQIIGHNIIKFDIPAIQKVYPWFTVEESKVFDTLVMSRLIWPDLMDRDEKAIRLGKLAKHLRGSHGLEAWGQRLGEWKGDYSKEMIAKGLDPWAAWNEDMQRYCEQDVAVTKKFLELIESKNTDPRAIELEHQIAHIIWEQEQTGFAFDEDAALALTRKLMEDKAAIEDALTGLFDPWWSYESTVTPKRTVNYKSVERHSTIAGAEYSKIKLNIFNPGSRAHIADRLMKVRGWKPTEFTANGQPKIDDEILQALPYPEAKKIAEYFVIQKRLGQVAEGNQAWLKKINPKTGRIHGTVVTNGAVTGRMTHNNPNVAQTPSVGAPYGAECRACWIVPRGKKLVGVDVAGLELRMLAHFMAPHDGGKYGDTVVNGDIHTANQEAAGLPTRNMAKTFIYGFLYGAGNAKIGSIVGKGSKHGGMLKKRFLEQTPALKKLTDGVSKKARSGEIRGLDGRILPIRHQHAALNTLLQSAGALVCKRWAVECRAERNSRGWQERVKFVANIHDEIQFEVDEEIAEEWAEVAVECIKRAGKYFRIRIPLDGDANIGSNWKETH